MEEDLNLHDIINLLKKRLGLILIVTTLAAVASAVISSLVLPEVYQASTQLLVKQGQTDEAQLNNMNIESDLQLVKTYSVIIKSPVILQQVVEQLNLDLSFDQINQQIIVESAENSQVIGISVKDADPATAVAIANKTVEILQSETQKLMNIDNVMILSPAKMSLSPLPVEPNPLLNTIMWAIAGLILGIGIAFILEYLDTTIKSAQEIKDLLGVPLIGTIPSFHDEEKKKVVGPIAFKR